MAWVFLSQSLSIVKQNQNKCELLANSRENRPISRLEVVVTEIDVKPLVPFGQKVQKDNKVLVKAVTLRIFILTG